MSSKERVTGIVAALVLLLAVAALSAWHQRLAGKVSALEQELANLRQLQASEAKGFSPRRVFLPAGNGAPVPAVPVGAKGPAAPGAPVATSSAPVPRWKPATDVERSFAASPSYPAAQRCLSESAEDLGEVTIRFKVSESGAPQDLHVDSAGDPDLDACLSRAVNAWRLPKPSGHIDPGFVVIYAD